jgi:hypothetical protein
MSGVVPLLSPYDFMAYTGTALPLPFGTFLRSYIVPLSGKRKKERKKRRKKKVTVKGSWPRNIFATVL